MARYLTATESRRHFLKLLDDLKAGEEIVVTRNGVPAAVLVDFDRLETLKQVARLWQDVEAIRAMREADEDIRAGRYISASPRHGISELIRRARDRGLLGD